MNTVSAAALHIDAANARYERDERIRISARLSQWLLILKHKCPVCWALKGLLVPRHGKPFENCREHLQMGYIPHSMGWMEFKQASQPKKAEYGLSYCFGCGSPLDEYMPDAHRDQKLGKECPWNDLIPVVAWLIYKDDKLWSTAQEALGINGLGSQPHFEAWCKVHTSRSRFSNAVHLFAWFCEYKGLA